MALIIRIVTFIITLFFIIILLLGATTSFSIEPYESDVYRNTFKVLSPKEQLINQLNIKKEFEEVTTLEEWTERYYVFTPLVDFDDDDDISICGAQLIIAEPSGHHLKYEFFTSIYKNEFQHHVILKSLILSLNNREEEVFEHFEQKLYGFEVIKNNQLITNLLRPKDSKEITFDLLSYHDFTKSRGKFYKTILEGGYDIRTFFFPENSRLIPVARNTWFLNNSKSIIDNCILELRNNKSKIRKPKGEIMEDVHYRVG